MKIFTSFLTLSFSLSPFKPTCQSLYDQASQNPLPGASLPQCDGEGNWIAEQCHGSTGYCHCVDDFGTKLPDTETFGSANCEKSNLVVGHSLRLYLPSHVNY